jgi:glycosyltransferase involved in cell wall biosynthesis
VGGLVSIARPVSIAVIIPTIGRDSLYRTLDALVLQLQPGDEVLVVADGPRPQARAIVQSYPLAGWRYFETAFTGHWGAEQRMVGIQEASADRLMFIDDDDAFAPGALVLGRSGPAPALYRMQYADGRVLWERPELEVGQVGTPMFVCRNERVGEWGISYVGDYRFITSTCQLQGVPAFLEPIIARIGWWPD